MPLDPNAHSLVAMVTTTGFFTPTCEPPGVLSATSHFQGVVRGMMTSLTETASLLCLDDIVIWGCMEEDLVDRVTDELFWKRKRGLSVAAQGCVLPYGDHVVRQTLLPVGNAARSGTSARIDGLETTEDS